MAASGAQAPKADRSKAPAETTASATTEEDKRSSINGVLRFMTFAEASAHLAPGGGAEQQKKGMPQSLAQEFLQLREAVVQEIESLPTETEGDDEKKTEDVDPKLEAEKAELLAMLEDVPDEADLLIEEEPMQAPGLGLDDAENEAPEAEEEAPAVEAEEAVEEVVEAPVPVAAKGKAKKPAAKKPAPKKPAAKKPAPKKPAAKKPAPKAAPTKAAPMAKAAKAKPGAAKTVPAPTPAKPKKVLSNKRAKQALAWSKKQKFASSTFRIRRYEEAIGAVRNGVLDMQFMQDVAHFQKMRGLSADGMIGPRTHRTMMRSLKNRGLMLKLNLTRLERKESAQFNTNRKRVKIATLGKMRKLLGLPMWPAKADWSFTNRLVRFQLQHGLVPDGKLTKKTQNALEDKTYFPLPGGEIISRYGMRFHPIHKVMKMHKGHDMVGPGRIVAAKSGVVKSVSNDAGGWGKYVVIQHKGFATLYAHCKSIAVGEGQRVTGGQYIAQMGATGGVTGAHLHFEVHKPSFGNAVNPDSIL